MDVSSQYAEFVVFGGTVFVVPGEHESEPPQYLFSTCPFAATIPPTCTADLGAAHTGTLSSLYKYVASTFAEDNGFDMWKSQIFYPAMRGERKGRPRSGRPTPRSGQKRKKKKAPQAHVERK